MIFILTRLFFFFIFPTCVTSRPGREVSGLGEEKRSKFLLGAAAEANAGVTPKPLSAPKFHSPSRSRWARGEGSPHPCSAKAHPEMGSVGEDSRGCQRGLFFPKTTRFVHVCFEIGIFKKIIIYYSTIGPNKGGFLAAPRRLPIPNPTPTFVSPAMGSVRRWSLSGCWSWRKKSLFGGCSSTCWIESLRPPGSHGCWCRG